MRLQREVGGKRGDQVPFLKHCLQKQNRNCQQQNINKENLFTNGEGGIGEGGKSDLDQKWERGSILLCSLLDCCHRIVGLTWLLWHFSTKIILLPF